MDDNSTTRRMSDASRVHDTIPSSTDTVLSRSQLHHTLDFFTSIRPFRGIIRDVKARGPYYISDWTDAWNYRVVPATALTFFSK